MEKYLKANAIFSKFSSNYLELRKELPIRPSELGVLNIIVQREGKFTPLMLAEMLEVSKPMISAHIMLLEKNGYIYKEYSKEDKRSFYVMPTDKAKKLVKETSEKINRLLQQIENVLGESAFEELIEMLFESNEVVKETLKKEEF